VCRRRLRWPRDRSPKLHRSPNPPRDEDLKLSEFPTLAHVVGFVRERRPDQPAPTLGATVATAADDVEGVVVRIVAEKTDYPPDMLDLDLDLEADLGVDTVKQAEVFAAIRGHYDIPRDENLQLSEFPTLAHVVGFVRERRSSRHSHTSSVSFVNGGRISRRRRSPHPP
jgi:acyl carrier protein